MPGVSRPSVFGTVARIRTLRVPGSTSGLMVVTSPSQVGPGVHVDREGTFWPIFTSASACCGSWNSA